MTSFSYVSRKPNTIPVPEALIEISNPANPSKSCQVNALVDSAADMTFIPESDIKSLGNLVSGIIKIRDANGNIKTMRTYFINLKIAEYNLPGLEVIAIPFTNALLGRDILNRFKIVLDGPNQKWSIE